jgi:hypothetical protein
MDFKKNPRPSTPSAKPIKPRKFRSSCDGCSASKVKCDQGQPQCLRCVNLGVRCNYSPSRRMGKPPASARQLSKSSNISSSDSEKQNTPNPAKKRQLSPPSEINIPAPSIENNQCIFDHSLMDTEDFMSTNWQDDMFSTSTFDGLPSSDFQLTSANLFDFNFNFTPDSTQLNNQFVFGDDSSLDSSRAASRDPFFEPLQLFPSNTSQPTAMISPRSSLAAPNLCAHQADFGRTPSPTPFLDTNSSIDQVLITNKAEIENAYALLACDCSHNPHFALTLALVCNKILAMYEAVIKPSPPSSDSSSSGCIGITVGAYKMDAEDEERMRIQIVVNELRKVKGLVDKYANKYGMVDGAVGDGEGAVYSALVSFLRSKFATTLQDLLTRLE